MVTPVPFAPAPHLAYTLRYNHLRETYQKYLLEQQRHAQEHEKIRLEKFQEKQRLEESRHMQVLLNQMNLYSHLGSQRANREYKYAFWASSLVDRYI